MRVAVVGAGIGGLCAAVGLHRSGGEVTVFERSSQVRSGGSGLSVFGNGMRALDALGVGESFRAITSPATGSHTGGQRRPDGRWLSIYPPDAVSELRVADRAALHEVLRSALPTSTIRTSARVTSARPDGCVTWAGPDGHTHKDQFDLVVAADGLGSIVRRSLPNDPGTTYAGYSAWRGISGSAVDLRGEAGETWGVKNRFGVAPLRDGRVYWFAVHSADRAQRFDDDEAELTARFGTWHDPIPELIASTPSEHIGYLPIDELAGPLPSFVHGKIVLLGDAAHAMTPDLGQGGGQAMEDAATLAALLVPIVTASHPTEATIKTLLARYDALRRNRTQTIARRSHTIGRLAHTPGRRLARARDLALRATPTSALRKQLAWLQDWTPPT